MTKKDPKYLNFKYYILSLEMQTFYYFNKLVVSKTVSPPVELVNSVSHVKKTYNKLNTILSPAYQDLLKRAPFAETIYSK